MDSYDHYTDIVVVGSGAGGMATAWTAARLGLDTLVLEKTELYGGNSALSGGGAWMPNAPHFLRLGERDDPEKLLAYLRAIAPEVDPARQRRYLEEVPKVAAAFETTPYFKEGAGFTWIKGYADYYPQLGGNPLGRGLWPLPIDQRVLGDDAATRRGVLNKLPGAPKGMWLTASDYHELLALRWGTWRGPRALLKLLWRAAVAALTGRQIVTGGAALMTRLRLMLRDLGIPLWLNTPMKSLITNDAGRVVGVTVEREGRPFRIGARQGVMLAAGGFEGSAELRRRHQPLITPGLSAGSPQNTGDGIVAGEQINAAIDLMDDAWWMPAIKTPSGFLVLMAERAYPHQFIVNAEGRRFVNESSPYTDFGHAQIEGHRSGVGHLPAFMIIDHYAWTHYMFWGLPGRSPPKDWLESGLMCRADTMEELADLIGVPRGNLVATAKRFNQFARQGRDEDYHRGESAYDRWYGNPKYPNPNLGEVVKPPFYAFTVVLSDLGTKGGLLTDENARVLRGDGTAIEGLYATGNNSASVMGHGYAGPGATLGPAMTFGWIAAHHIASAAAVGSVQKSGLSAIPLMAMRDQATKELAEVGKAQHRR